jgi:hypothetical protein
MISYGYCFRPAPDRSDCSGKLYLWIADRGGEIRLMQTPYDVRHEEWDPVTGSIVFTSSEPKRLQILLNQANCMLEEQRIIKDIVHRSESLDKQCRATKIAAELNEHLEYAHHYVRL